MLVGKMEGEAAVVPGERHGADSAVERWAEAFGGYRRNATRELGGRGILFLN